jgi:hypothetical protein
MAVIKRPGCGIMNRLGSKSNQHTPLTLVAFLQSLESETLSVRLQSHDRTDGHGNLISPKAGLKREIITIIQFGSFSIDYY